MFSVFFSTSLSVFSEGVGERRSSRTADHTPHLCEAVDNRLPILIEAAAVSAVVFLVDAVLISVSFHRTFWVESNMHDNKGRDTSTSTKLFPAPYCEHTFTV